MYRDGPIIVTSDGAIALEGVGLLAPRAALEFAEKLRLVATIALALAPTARFAAVEEAPSRELAPQP